MLTLLWDRLSPTSVIVIVRYSRRVEKAPPLVSRQRVSDSQGGQLAALYHCCWISKDAAVLKDTTTFFTSEMHSKIFSDTAALILQLDLAISVDTSVAHLDGPLESLSG